MAQPATLPVASAEPSKAFFIEMLTRDIPLSVCILDLIDNSIHSLISETDLDVSEHLFSGTTSRRVKALIEIQCTPKKFRIADNCGGIPGRLYPSHYSLLYFTKGSPKTFHKIRVPIRKCRHCGGDIKDYGGHKGALNAKGLNLTDVWDDIPPVRHWRFKSPR